MDYTCGFGVGLLGNVPLILGFCTHVSEVSKSQLVRYVLNGIEMILRAQTYSVQMHLDLMFWTAVWDVCCDWGSVQDGFFHEQGREA